MQSLPLPPGYRYLTDIRGKLSPQADQSGDIMPRSYVGVVSSPVAFHNSPHETYY